MLELRYQSRFKRDIKLLKKRGYDLQALKIVVDLLLTGNALPVKYNDHPLGGNWIGHRECHVDPDWLLIYRVDKGTLILTLVRSGTHSDLLE